MSRIDRSGRRKNGAYWMIRMPQHPRADSSGYVREHILIVEKALGHALPEFAVVHHVDGDKEHNANGNFVLCEDQAYHMLLHRRERAFLACGHADWRRCYYCRQYDAPENLYIPPRVGAGNVFHRSCAPSRHNHSPLASIIGIREQTHQHQSSRREE